MRLGALLGPIDGENPRAITEQAIQLEAQGYTSLWTAQAMGRGFILTDPFVALSAAAAVTSTVELGTAILQLPLYSPTDVALKSYALGQLSGGRFILGVGAGSTRADYEIHGEAFEQRFSQFEIHLQRLRGIFATGRAWEIELKPWASQQQGAPIYFGTWGKNVARAAAEFDGWIASGMHRSVEECGAALAGYRDAGGGRALVSTIQVVRGQDLGELRERLACYAEAGFDDAVLMFMPGGPTSAEVRALVA